MEISKMLTLSTAHITKETAEALDNEVFAGCPYLVVYQKDDYGWFVYLPSKIEKIDIPHDLKKCMLFAKDLGCDWLCLDANGEVLKYLHIYNW